MRIISDFHDYYDGLMSLDEDRELIYKRKQEIETYKWLKYRSLYHGESTDSKNYYPLPYLRISEYDYFGYITGYCIGFCGNTYGIIRVNHKQQKEFYLTTQEVEAYIHTLDKKAIKKFYNDYGSNGADVIDKFLNDVKEATKYQYLFNEHKAPIFIGDCYDRTVTYNAKLKDFHFYKIKDAYTAYQELVVYLTNQGNPEKPIPQLNNKDMIQSKGFDLKTSFRKDKK